MDGRIFRLTLMPEAVPNATVDGWAGEARLAMPFEVVRRLVGCGGVCLNINIDLQWIGEVDEYFTTCKS